MSPLALSAAAARRLGLKATGRSKYGARKTTVDGITFDSKREANRWSVLKQLELIGEVRALERQRRYRLEVNGVHVCDWVADFEYWHHRDDDWQKAVEDCKGVRTPVYRLKKKLMLAVWGIHIVES